MVNIAMVNIKDTKRRERILNGNLTLTILTICAPIFFYNFFNSFYSIIDAVVVSKINSTSVSAVASLGQIKLLLSSLGAGIASGGGIIVARTFGAGDFDLAKKKSNQVISMSSILIGALLLICIPLAVPIMKFAKVPDELIAIGTGYFIVEIISLAFVFYNSVFMAMEKAKGNTKIMFFLNIMVMAIKLSLSILFIYGLNKDDIIWVGIATLIGQASMFLVLLLIMLSKKNIFKIDFKEFKLEKETVSEVAKISLPIFLGKFVFSFGKVSVNAMCNEYGPLVVGALGVSNNLCGVATTPINSFEETTSTIVSQNLGNKNIKRAFGAFWRSFIIATILGLIGFVLIRFVFQDQLIELYNQNKDSVDTVEFLKLIKEINRFDSYSIIALAVNAAVLGILYGFGQTKMTMILNISRVFLFRIPILWYLQTFHKELGAQAAGISMGISNLCVCVTSILFLVYFVFKIKKYGYREMYI